MVTVHIHTASGVAWQRSPCLGQCDAGSAALVLRAGSVAERFVVAPVRDAEAWLRALR